MKHLRIAALVGTLLGTTLAPSAAEARPGRRAPRGPSCERSTPTLEKRSAAADAFTRASFDRALASAHLSIAALRSSWLDLGDPRLATVRWGATFSLEASSPPQLALFAREGDQDGPADDEFVADATGTIDPLVRRPHERSGEEHTICGCGDMGRGTAPRMAALIYVLPAGASFGAPIEVAYDARRVALHASRTEHGSPCRLPP